MGFDTIEINLFLVLKNRNKSFSVRHFHFWRLSLLLRLDQAFFGSLDWYILIPCLQKNKYDSRTGVAKLCLEREKGLSQQRCLQLFDIFFLLIMKINPLNLFSYRHRKQNFPPFKSFFVIFVCFFMSCYFFFLILISLFLFLILIFGFWFYLSFDVFNQSLYNSLESQIALR